MEKQMERISIKVNDEHIELRQPSSAGCGDDVIWIHPDQADIVMAWIKEAKDEIQNASK